MEAIILAGGFGTRLRSIISNVPKPMAPIKDVPFLKYILDYLIDNNINRVILAVGYKWEIIEQYFGNQYKELELAYSIENEPLGTGGAIKQALEMCQTEDLFIINGDTYFNVDLIAMRQSHLNNKADLTIATKLMINFDRYGKVVVEKERIIDFEEKQFNTEGLINGGIYLCKKDSLAHINMTKFSFEKDFMEKEITNKKIMSFESHEYFIDIGIPEDYRKFEKEMCFFE
ncbi:D-glycero-D-manno-heptose 1-phosphate guanosyltransferase [Clostridium botulinum]|uniref:nucleotidyltransferase family protein n=1 Tax=Clostridium botulinum TaxID=1491 RepID=UPI001966D160|nr:nucleotidyltransferase family protein [Clostridium botulinum]MBN1075621.1 D-glycero-D-manno-heptose 1-phosphate guanosyltransferase [Clostridium botulinum]